MKIRFPGHAGSPLFAVATLLASTSAFAQDPPPASASHAAPSDAPLTPPGSTAQPESGAPNGEQPPDAKSEPDRRPRLLAPRYGEDFYPAMSPQDGLLRSATIDDKRGLRFALHGYFRAPMRITKAARAAPKPGEGEYNWRTPYLIDDDYFRSG